MRSTMMYSATFKTNDSDSRDVVETYFALDDSHAVEVAKEIGARRRLIPQSIMLVGTRDPDPKAVVAGRIFNQEKK